MLKAASLLSISMSCSVSCLGTSSRRMHDAQWPWPAGAVATTNSMSFSSSASASVPSPSGLTARFVASTRAFCSNAVYRLCSVSITTNLVWRRFGSISATCSILRGVYRNGMAVSFSTPPSRSSVTMRKVFPAMATRPSGHCSEEKLEACSRLSYERGVSITRVCHVYTTHDLLDRAKHAALPPIFALNSLMGRDPRNLWRVSERVPVRGSSTVRCSTPFWRPMFRYRVVLAAVPTVMPPASTPPPAPESMSTMAMDSGAEGSICSANT
mmetsp:Transcript_33157/g.53760  ORF Transcript_33157/g.53760 Transcript_33157/m.53760 type:complete len:269 (-) Transcript_33157:1916-2722(-)